MSSYRRLLRLIMPYRRLFPVTIIAMMVLAMTTAAYAFLLGPGLSHLITGGDRGFHVLAAEFEPFNRFLAEHGMKGIAWLLVSIVVVKGIAYSVQFISMRWIGSNVVVDLRDKLFDSTLGQEKAFFDRRRGGDLLSRFTTDVVQVEYAVVDAMASGLRSGLVILALVLQCFLLDFWLAVVAFAAVPLAVIPISVFLKTIRRIARQYLDALGAVTDRIAQALGGIELIKASASEDRERTRVSEAHQQFLGVMWRSILARGAYSPVIELLGVTGLAAVLWYAQGRMELPESHADYLAPEFFVSFFATLVLIYAPIKEIGRISTFIATGMAASERIFEVIDRQAEIVDAADAQALAGVDQSLSFEAVEFAYSEADGERLPTVLKGLSFTVPKGETYALVGPSGCGKSTLLQLVPRFYDVTEGAIRVDGTDLRQLSQQSLRRQVAVVSQDVILFHDTVRANIAYAAPGSSEAAIIEAAKAAQAWNFIQELPKGLDTQVGDRGVRLSGGQRQRIAIARALLKDAPILLLDEATSALDSESERAVQSALEQLMVGRTVLVVAHRLGTVRRAHQILVLSRGQVVEQGSHQDLMAKGGYYARQVELEEA
ncbi:MAG: ABC transporter [Myxococcales bacterium]|nr:ABC transporter [Myxococcales bacterium]|tara:strand:+ start:1798 stop:3600 length:1803 start_codon:yes stop_codon:yes gene_type:complete